MKPKNIGKGLQHLFLWSVLLCIFGLTFSFQAYAQDEEMLERTWYLYKLEMEGEEYLYYELDIDSGDESNIEIVLNDNSTADIEMDGCPGWGCSSSFEFAANESEIILDGAGCLTTNPCDSYMYYGDDTAEFTLIFNYYSSFYQPADSVVEYEIENIDNVDFLIFTNENGDKIYYSAADLSTPEFEKLPFSLSPNPVQNQLFIQMKDFSSAMNLEVYDMQGKLINKIDVREGEIQLDVSEYASGIYFIRMKDELGNRQVKKFVKK